MRWAPASAPRAARSPAPPSAALPVPLERRPARPSAALPADSPAKGAAEVVNPEPTDRREDHNLARGTGAGAGALAGRRRGRRAVPVGMAAGAAIGAVAGGMAGEGAAEVVNRRIATTWASTSCRRALVRAPGLPAARRSGSVAGPIGTVAAAAIGGIAGGAAGKGAGEVANPRRATHWGTTIWRPVSAPAAARRQARPSCCWVPWAWRPVRRSARWPAAPRARASRRS